MPLYDERGRIVPTGAVSQAPNQFTAPTMQTGPRRIPVPAAMTAPAAITAPVRLPAPQVQEPVRHQPQPAPPIQVPFEPLIAPEPPVIAPAPAAPAAPTVHEAAVVGIGATGPIFAAPAIPVDNLLRQMLAVGEGVSDLFFMVGRPPQVENFGKLMPVIGAGCLNHFEPQHTEGIARTLVNGNPRLLEDLRETGSCDSSYAIEGLARFRVNVFKQKGTFAVVLRKLNTQIPSMAELGLPSVFQRIVQEKTGLVFITGATGSGKTTTLAAMLNELNETAPMHIVTLEDPVEYLHPHKQATFCQREMGRDFSTFAMGLRAALRQAPKVILVGEIRDRETMEIALTAAETGHVVFSTLHTISAGQSIYRMLGLFGKDEEKQVRERLSETVRWVVSQRLAQKVGGGRVLIPEIMGNNLRSREAIQLGETDVRSFADIIEQAQPEGWCTFEQSLTAKYQEGVITEETAMLLAVNKSRMRQRLDLAKKSMGRDDTTTNGIKLLRTDEHLKPEKPFNGIFVGAEPPAPQGGDTRVRF